MQAPDPELVLIPAGPFLMGSNDGDDNERPEHVVTVDAFRMASCPVTQADYAAFVRATGRRPPGVWETPAIVRADRVDEFMRESAPYTWAGTQPPAGRDDHPVVLVTVHDADSYCRWLSDTTGRRFELPTEAQWEKAARGGLDRQRYPWGDTVDVSMANFTPQARRRAGRGTTPVRAYPPNAMGLFGMAGNTWDWTADWYRQDYYAVSDTRNPAGPAGGALRVVRGGAWTNSDVDYLRCARRHPVPPDTYSYSIGFRVACRE
jgi:formylglycine-generating enzyme